MRKAYLLIAMTAIVFAVSQGVAHAEMIQGKIIEVNPEANYMKVNRTDVSAGSESLKLAIRADTSFKGAGSLQDFSVGDQVMVDADQNMLTRQWTAKSIEQAAKKAASGAQPSQTRRNASSPSNSTGESAKPAAAPANSSSATSPSSSNPNAAAGSSQSSSGSSAATSTPSSSSETPRAY